MKRKRSKWIIGFIVLTLLLSIPFFAYRVKGGKANLDSLAYIAPELRVTQTGEDFSSIKEGFSASGEIAKFLNDNGGEWRAYIDLRRGVPSLLEGKGIPFLPGQSNGLSWDSFGSSCESIQCIPREKVETLAREFLERYPGLFPVKQDELVMDLNGTLPVWESIYLLRFQWVVNDIPVEGASIYFRINNGGLIQVASTKIAPVAIDTVPKVTKETAWQILNGYLGDSGVGEKDEILEAGRLSIIPATKKGMDPETYSGTIGSMADYRLVYKMTFRRPGVQGTWEAAVDAHSGEILRFVDINRYGRVHGGAKLSDGVPLDQDVAFPFADIGGGLYADATGSYSGNNATTTLTGRYCTIADACGSISLVVTDGDSDFITDATGTAVSNCSVPAGNAAGLGNTKSARTQYYNLTAVNLKAQVYAPTNTWLTSSSITAETNDGTSCNAYSSGPLVHFYKRIEGSCNNLGEIPGVSMHEWSHSYDDYDGSGTNSAPVETYADWTAIVQTHNSCTGAGFYTSGTCDGYGDACDTCTGIRDCDYMAHASNQPWTSTNYGTVWSGCDSGSYFGPCGKEDHCESGISTQALWDFVNRDLVTYCGMDVTSGWMLEDRLWFTGVATLDNSYTCASMVTSGCTGDTLYTVMRAIDDDDANPNNGTPHAQAIFQALARHNIACGAAGDAANQNYTTCPSLSTPTLTAAGGSNSVALSWTTGGVNATRYFVFKNETGCDTAFNRIAIVTAPTLTYTDTACANGYTYYYRVQAVTANDACTSASSNCVVGLPVECQGAIALEKGLYACTSTVNVTVQDSSAPSSPFNCEAWSTSDPTHRSFSVSGTGSPYTGSFTTTSGAGGPGVVHVAHGDTLYSQYTDPDNCGSGSLAVQTTAVVDCVGPVISNVQATAVTGSGATITWTTDEGSNSYVVYQNATPPSASNATVATIVTGHSVPLTGLTECTKYWFYVQSTDPAGNASTDNNGGLYYTFVTGKNVNPTYASADVPKAIPDSTTVTSTITVTDDKLIQDVNVTLTNVAHTYDGDLDIFLIAPDATRVELTTDNGSGGDNFVDTVFDDEAATLITAGTAPFTGSFIPEGSLATLDGKNATGTWTLEVTDDAGGDTGTLNGWSITFTYPAESCPSSEGTVEFDKTIYGGSSTMNIIMKDNDLLGTGTHDVEVFSTTETAPETVSLTENPANSATFKGSFLTGTGAVANGDGHVTVVNGDTITVRYIDADDGAGGTDIPRTDTAAADVVGPVITDVLVTNVTPTTATVTWTTGESANSRVTYGDSIPPATNRDDLATYVTSHTMNLSGLTPCTTYYISVTSADIYGNSVTDNNGGSYYSFTTQGMAYAFGPFGAESGTAGWTLTGEWHQDTCKIHGGTYAMKAGSVTCPGTYATSTTSDMTWGSDINLGLAGHGYHLRYWEYYQTESCCDDLRPQISTNGGTSWTNLTEYAGTGTAWAQRDIDLAAYSGNVRLRFEFYSDGSIYYEGWYLDDIEISKPIGCSAELVYQGNTMTEACNGSGSGGGNTILEPGEDATIGITMFNNGMANATGVSATLSSSTPGITVTTGSATYPDINAGAAGTSATNYVVHVDPSVTCVTTANFTLHSTSVQNPAGTDSYFTIDVGQAGGAVTDFSENFASVTVPSLPAGWTVFNAGSGATNWVTYNGYACSSPNSLSYHWDSTYAANVWAFTPGIALSAGVTYTLNFTERIGSTSWPEKFEVRCGTSADVAGQTITILAEATYTNTTCSALAPTFTVPATGTYYIGFHCTSAADMFYLTIDDINLTHSSLPVCNVCTPSCTTPSQPSIGSVLDNDPDVQDGVTVTFAAGSPSTSNSLLVDTVEVATGITSPYVHDPGDTASHSYVVRTYNTASCHSDSAPVACTDEEETAVIPGEVATGTDFTWTASQSAQAMNWTADPDSDYYNLYRGLQANLAALCDGTADFCWRDSTGPTTMNVTSDDPSGQAGRCYYYLITGVSGAGEGPSGTATCGARQINHTGGCS